MTARRVGLYARVSTASQHHALQLDELRETARHRGYQVTEYIDTGSGSGVKLPDRARMLDDARTGRLDVVMIWRLDRLGRSLRDLIEIVENLKRWNVALVSAREAIDTSTPAGQLLFNVMGSLAQFERELIRERVCAGQEAARQRGRHPGRPRREVDLARADALLAGGMPKKAAARHMGISPRTFNRALERRRQKPVEERSSQEAEITAADSSQKAGGGN